MEKIIFFAPKTMVDPPLVGNIYIFSTAQIRFFKTEKIIKPLKNTKYLKFNTKYLRKMSKMTRISDESLKKIRCKCKKK